MIETITSWISFLMKLISAPLESHTYGGAGPMSHDGKSYFLKVPLSIQTCREAVTWTLGFEEAEEYQPLAES